MSKELGKGNTYPELLEKLAQYEYALEKFMMQTSALRSMRHLPINAGPHLKNILAMFHVT